MDKRDGSAVGVEKILFFILWVGFTWELKKVLGETRCDADGLVIVAATHLTLFRNGIVTVCEFGWQTRDSM